MGLVPRAAASKENRMAFIAKWLTHAGILVDGFGAALLGAVIVSVVSMMLGGVIR